MSKGVLFESGEEMAAGGGGDFKLLPEDEYIVRIDSIEVLENQTSQYNTTAHDEWKVRFDIVSFATAEPVYYEDGTEPDPAREVRLTCFIDPTRKGMIPQPSKARKFLTAALGQNVESRIELDDVQDLIGKRLVAGIFHKKDSNGVLRDRFNGNFRAIRAPRARAATAPTESVEAKAEASLALASDVFNEDLKF